MKRKNRIFVFLVIVGVITYFMLRPSPQLIDSPTLNPEQTSQPIAISSVAFAQSQSDDEWIGWVDIQVDLVIDEIFRRFREELPYEGPPEVAMNIGDLKRQLREVIVTKAEELKKNNEIPPPLRLFTEEFTTLTGYKLYDGPQTVEALLISFKDMPTSPIVEKKYPQAEWVEMLLEKGVTIQHFGDYFRYLTLRRNLISLEERQGEWISGRYGIPPTVDWETYKYAYIDRKIWENQKIQNAWKSDPTIVGGIFKGANGRLFLPTGGGRYYVKRKVFEDGISIRDYGGYMNPENLFNLHVHGIEPKGYKIIYLDDNDVVLSEPLPVISEKEFQEQVFQQVRVPSKFKKKEYTQEEIAARSARRLTQSVQRELETLTHDFKTNAGWQSFFETSILNEAEVPPLKHTEALILEKYPERFESAINLIHIHGPEEGIRQLKNVDSDIAVHIENWFRAAYIQNKNTSR